jgi:SAM-dependent methyltransferase
MDIQESHQNWTELGKTDPMWVVLTFPDKKGGKWTEAEFFQNGREEIGAMMEKLRENGVLTQRGKALDFGCGLGRLSQALAGFFSSVDGVDISASMIEQARELNRSPDVVRYHLNLTADLTAFASQSYDFVCSSICLQHIPTQYQLRYIAEFMRLLRTGGVAHFQTIHARGWRAALPGWLVESYRGFKHRGKPYIPMYGAATRRVRDVLARSGGSIRLHQRPPYQGWESRFRNDVFLVVKENCAI